MSDLKQMVRELFEKDRQMNSIEKEIKTKRAHYHHLILKNSEKVYSDVEVAAINMAFEELNKLEEQKSVFKDRFSDIKNMMLKLLNPLNGGRWVHETEDPINPRWEFWVEDEELKYARLNGAAY
jgi:chromosome segregation ATPase